MKAPKAPVLKEIKFDFLSGAFYRRKYGNGEIFFAGKCGRCTIGFPVRKDGVIMRTGSDEGVLMPAEIVEVIHLKDLGISKIRWED